METRSIRRHGLIDAATAGLADGLAAIESMHGAIARKPFSFLRLVPAVAPIAEVVGVLHDSITAGAYGTVRNVVRLGGAVARGLPSVAEDREPEAGSLGDLAIAAVNGFAGDRLERQGSPLATPMQLRHAGKPVAIDPAALASAFPSASARLAIFVHGLACNETAWRMYAERHYADSRTTYGTRLEADLGYTPLYVRYNSGRHISENGRDLASLIGRVLEGWPVPVEEIVLIGHSMGGLVTRSATHYGAQSEWAPLVRHVILLGSPHLGAPLEKAVNVAARALAVFDVTRPIATILNRRSAGIKDLRFGALRDDDWEGIDLDALLANRAGDVPLLDCAAHYFIAASVTSDPRHPIGRAIGDVLVRTKSAFGHHRLQRTQFAFRTGAHFGAMHHLELLNHPDVYAQLRCWLEPPA